MIRSVNAAVLLLVAACTLVSAKSHTLPYPEKFDYWHISHDCSKAIRTTGTVYDVCEVPAQANVSSMSWSDMESQIATYCHSTVSAEYCDVPTDVSNFHVVYHQPFNCCPNDRRKSLWISDTGAAKLVVSFVTRYDGLDIAGEPQYADPTIGVISFDRGLMARYGRREKAKDTSANTDELVSTDVYAYNTSGDDDGEEDDADDDYTTDENTASDRFIDRFVDTLHSLFGVDLFTWVVYWVEFWLYASVGVLILGEGLSILYSILDSLFPMTDVGSGEVVVPVTPVTSLIRRRKRRLPHIPDKTDTKDQMDGAGRPLMNLFEDD